MIAALFIAVVAFVIVAYFLSQVNVDLQAYSRATSFPSPNILFFGTLVAFLSTAYYSTVQQRERNTSWELLLIPLFYVFYIFFITNATLRAEYFANGARTPITVGAFWLGLCMLVLGGIALKHTGGSSIFYLYVPLIWLAYMTYYWCYS